MKLLALGVLVVGCRHASPHRAVPDPVAPDRAQGDEVGGSTYGGAFPRAAPARRGPDPACSANPVGDALFESEVRVEGGAKLPTARKRLYANGAWTDQETSAEGIVTDRRGCVSRTGFDTIRADLASATWTVTSPPLHCMAVSASHTVYSVRGKVVFDERVCGDVLDDRNERLRREIVDGLDFSVSTSGN